MRTYKVGLCDSDLEYTTTLMEYACGRPDFGISFAVFSGMTAIGEYLIEGHLDLIVTDDLMGCDVTEGGYTYMSVQTIQFSEYRESDDGWQVKETIDRYIYKYQKASNICQLLRDILAAGKEKGTKVSETIAVYSPLGRCGKTRLAKALAMDDEVRGGLYIAMEDIGINGARLANDILYLLKSGSPDLMERLNEEITNEEGVYILRLSSSFVDTRDVTPDDVISLQKSLLGLGRFSTLVFDIGTAATSDLRILNCFDRLYMPVLRDNLSALKVETFMSYLSSIGLRNIITRLVPVDVPDVDIGSVEMQKAVWILKEET